MSKKCNKFESLFTFSDEKTLLEHISECEDCKAEYEKMNKVTELIKEVKPHYRKGRFNAVRVACILFAFMISGVTLQYADMNYGIVDSLMYNSQYTAEELGFETDDYGLIMVGE